MRCAMIRGFIFDYGGTLDTGGQHWGKVIWHAYEHLQVPVSETDFRDAYVHAERTLGKNPIIQPDFTFYKTLETKISIQLIGQFIESLRHEPAGLQSYGYIFGSVPESVQPSSWSAR